MPRSALTVLVLPVLLVVGCVNPSKRGVLPERDLRRVPRLSVRTCASDARREANGPVCGENKIAGVVRGTNGSPVQNLEVTFLAGRRIGEGQKLGFDDFPSAVLRTDFAGRFQSVRLGDEPILIWVASGKGFRPLTFVVDGECACVEIDVDPLIIGNSFTPLAHQRFS